MKHDVLWVTCLTCAGLLLSTAAVPAQTVNPDPGSGDSPQQRSMLEERIRQRIREQTTLEPGERRRMESHLEQCLRLGMRDDRIEALFPLRASDQAVSARHLLRFQERVLAAGEAGLATDLLADKIREGRMKRVAADAIEGAVARLEHQLRVAQQVMTRAVREGVGPSASEATRRQLQRGIALDLWRGLGEADLEQLREHARSRARDRDCTTVELAAAAETTTDIVELGIEGQRARQMVGSALEQGYAAEELRQLGRLIRVTVRRGTPPERALELAEARLLQGDSMQNMVREMMQHGWLGPRDLAGSGGHSPVDHVIGGPGHHGDGQQSGQQGPESGGGPGGAGSGRSPTGGQSGSGGA